MDTAGGTLIMERNMEHGRWNSNCETEHETLQMELPLRNGTWNTADGTLILERNMEHTRQMELSLSNGTWKKVGETPIIERNMEYGGWNSHNRTEHGTHRMELPLWNGT